MQLRQLEVFSKVVELGSYTKAAETLFLTQPGVTFHIQSLEKDIGASLFRRQGRRMVLTEAGEIFFPYALRALNDLKRGIHETHRFLDSDKQTISFGAATNLALSYLLPAMGQFFTQVGPVQVQMETGISDDLIHKLEEGELDLVLIWGPIHRTDLQVETLAEEEWLLILPADPEFAPISPNTTEGRRRLSRKPFVLPAPGMTRRFVESSLTRNGIRPQVVMELKIAKLILDAVISGKGVGLIPGKTIEGFEKRGLLHKYSLQKKAFRTMNLVFHKDLLIRKPFAGQVVDRVSRTIKNYLQPTAST